MLGMWVPTGEFIMKLTIHKGGKGLTGKEWDEMRADLDPNYAERLKEFKYLTWKAGMDGCPQCKTYGKDIKLCEKHYRERLGLDDLKGVLR